MSSPNSDAKRGACLLTPNGDAERPHLFPTINCTLCGNPIPEARLLAMPDAMACVPCLEASGDVSMIRRFDEQTGEGIVETYFFSDFYINNHIERVLRVTPPTEAMKLAVGDDSFVEREDAKKLEPDTTEDEIINNLTLIGLPFWPFPEIEELIEGDYDAADWQ